MSYASQAAEYADDPELEKLVSAAASDYENHIRQEEARLRGIVARGKALAELLEVEDQLHRINDYPRLEEELRVAQKTINELEKRTRMAQDLLSGEWDGY